VLSNPLAMKKLLLFPLAAIACAFTFIQHQPAAIKPIAIGTSMPNGDLKMLNVMNDKEMSLNELKKEKGLLVIFSCNTCPFVIANEDRIHKIQQEAQELNIGVAILNSNEGKRDADDSKDAMRNYGNEQKFLFPYLVDADSKMADAFGATRTPETYLFDKAGKLVYQGAIDDSPKDEAGVTKQFLHDAMSALADGQPIGTSSTVSSGCTIKRKQ
jgi:thioredoxin-related protein